MAMETNTEHLFVANLKSVSLENLIRKKLEVFFNDQKEENPSVDINDLYGVVMEQVEKPLIELSLKNHKGNQVRTAKMLGINRNTLKKKIDTYDIKFKN